MKLIKISFFMAFSILLSSNGFAVSAEREAAIAERIKPVGDVCIEGDSGCAAAVVVKSSEPRTGQEIFNASCTGCHSTGAAGAPKVGDVADWAARKGSRGMKGLYVSAIKGFNGMPPKGLCMDCSDSELKAAVHYILSKSK